MKTHGEQEAEREANRDAWERIREEAVVRPCPACMVLNGHGPNCWLVDDE